MHSEVNIGVYIRDMLYSGAEQIEKISLGAAVMQN